MCVGSVRNKRVRKDGFATKKELTGTPPQRRHNAYRCACCHHRIGFAQQGSQFLPNSHFVFEPLRASKRHHNVPFGKKSKSIEKMPESTGVRSQQMSSPKRCPHLLGSVVSEMQPIRLPKTTGLCMG